MAPSRRTPSRRAGGRAARQEVVAFDEPEPRGAGGSAGEERRDREEELVDEPGREQRPNTCGPPSERISRWPRSRRSATSGAEVERRARPRARRPRSAAGSRPARRRGALVGREDERAALERRDAPGSTSRSREHDELRRRGRGRAGGGARRSRPRRRERPAPASRARAARRAACPSRSRPRRRRRAGAPSRSGRQRFRRDQLVRLETAAIATTPSTLATKFANSRGSSKPSEPP